jgi:hypothetical protein
MAKRGLTGLSLPELQREIRRRERRVSGLITKRDRLIQRVEAIDREIISNGGNVSGRGGRVSLRRRPRNDSNLADALVDILKNTEMSVTDVAQAVQNAGYVTTSPNFRTIVNQTLLKDSRIKKVRRGIYTSKGGGGGGGRKRGKKAAAEAAA